MVGITQPLDLNGRKAGRVGVAERELALKEAQVANRARELGAEVRLKAGEVMAAQRRYIDIEMGYTDALQHAYNAVVATERAVGAASR